MAHFKSDFLQASYARGFIHQGTDLEALDQRLCTGPVTAYLGFDPTADSLHVGHLVGIMWLRLLQQTGNKPIALLGGATSMIGDPTGKDELRKALTPDDVATNIKGIQKSFSHYLTFGDGQTDACLVNNAEWLMSLSYVDFLRVYGPHFSVNRMLTFDSVRLRLEREQPLSFLEFNYMIFQAYDFLHLYRTQNCCLQLGGSDQWGNIVNGVELTRRVTQKAVFGLTAPLITTASGAKMGKTTSGAVWINPDRMAAYDYWQFWRNTDDRDVVRYLKLFTDLPLDEIARLAQLQGAELNTAKKILADEATAFIHGKENLCTIHETVKELFESQNGADLANLPKVPFAFTETLTVEALFVAAGLCASKGEARRLIDGKGAKLNDQVVTDPKEILTKSHFVDKCLKLSAGKKKHIVLELTAS